MLQTLQNSAPQCLFMMGPMALLCLASTLGCATRGQTYAFAQRRYRNVRT